MFTGFASTILLAITLGLTLTPPLVEDVVFGLTRVHQVHATVAAKDYVAMQPPPPKAFGKAPPAADPNAGAGNFGFEFKYVPSDVQVDGQPLYHVGLRYKGSGSYLVSQHLAKRSLKIDFDRYKSDQSYLGHAKLNLNSSVMDPSKVREALAYTVFRAAGVPAPRTAFAEVSLTVSGKYDKEYLGFYTIVEQVDEPFLQNHFQNGRGLLLKPEGIRGLPHYGDDVAAYEKNYNVKSKKGRGDIKRLIEFTRLVNQADEAEFRQHIGSYLDIDGFVRFLAANTMLSSLDGFTGMGHNFYLYLSPTTGKFSFIPWDLDLAFGAFAIYGTVEQLTDLSITHPHLGENKLIDRLLAMPDVKSAYLDQIRHLAKEVFTSEKLGKDLAAVEAIAKEPVDKERKSAAKRKEMAGFGPPGGMFAGLPIRTFIEKRVASINAQLEGKKPGFVPKAMNFGPPRK